MHETLGNYIEFADDEGSLSIEIDHPWTADGCACTVKEILTQEQKAALLAWLSEIPA
jgi:hypothetical protein